MTAPFSDKSALEKGREFELRLAALFRSQGYDVEHDAHVAGRSGAAHQIDLLLTHRGPLHTSRILVEAKAYLNSVDKDRIIKLMHVVADIGADRGIIVTTSQFTASAYLTADGSNVDLWDRERLAPLLAELDMLSPQSPQGYPVSGDDVIIPTNDTEGLKAEVERLLSKRAKGFLGVGKVIEYLEGIQLFYLPFFDLQLEVLVKEKQRVGLFGAETVERSASTSVSFDGLLGVPVTAGSGQILFPFDWMALLSDDERRLVLAARGLVFRPGLLSMLEIPQSRAKRALDALIAKEVAYQATKRPVSYAFLRRYPSDPVTLLSLQQQLLGGSAIRFSSPGSLSEGQLVVPGVRAEQILACAAELWPNREAQSLSLIRYPYFFLSYRRSDGSRREEILDGLSLAAVTAPRTRIDFLRKN